jgi:cysteine desulfurase / selenocysteine lyase
MDASVKTSKPPVNERVAPTREKPISFYYATVAPLSETAYAAAHEYLEMYHANGSPEVLLEYERKRRTVEGVAEEAAKLLYCNPNEITFVPNTTYGLNIASNALPFEKGDEILVQNREYKTNYWPWIQKRECQGCAVREIGGKNSAESFEKIIAAITPKTKAVVISWIQYYDGYISDLNRLSAVCQKNSAFLVVDAVQGIGIRALDLQKTRIDILASGGQKYLCAGPGTGFLYINSEIMPLLRDTFIGIRSMNPGPTNQYKLKDNADRFQTGTIDMQAAVQLHAALKEVNDTGIECIERQNLSLLKEFKKILSANNIPFIDYGDQQGNIISLTVSDPSGLVKSLAADRIYIKQINDVARISFHHTSRLEDFEEFVEAAKEFLK